MSEPTNSGSNDLSSTPNNVYATIKRISIPVLAVSIVVVAVTTTMAEWDKWIAGAAQQSTDDASINVEISRLSAQISGTIRRVEVGDYQHVKKGQLLAEIEPASYQAAVDIAEANLKSAQASLANHANQMALQEASIAAAIAQKASAIAQHNRTREEFKRQTDLGGATTVEQIQEAQAADLEAQAAVQSSSAAIQQQQAQLKVLEGQKALLKAAIDAATGSLETAKINLGYTQVYAPLDGRLGKLNVHPGDFVSAGTAIVSLVPLPNVYVIANFKETQLSHMGPGSKASITVDTFPGKTLIGRVAEVSPASGSVFALLPPDNATGNFTKIVQRMPVKIIFDTGQALVGRLASGMSANVTVETPREPDP